MNWCLEFHAYEILWWLSRKKSGKLSVIVIYKYWYTLIDHHLTNKLKFKQKQSLSALLLLIS